MPVSAIRYLRSWGLLCFKKIIKNSSIVCVLKIWCFFIQLLYFVDERMKVSYAQHCTSEISLLHPTIFVKPGSPSHIAEPRIFFRRWEPLESNWVPDFEIGTLPEKDSLETGNKLGIIKIFGLEIWRLLKKFIIK